jgi:hypothetical protein
MIKPKKLSLRIAAILAVGLASGTTAMAQASDVLLDKLVEKGVLTVKEANDLREEADKDFSKAYSAKSGMPDWVRSFRINGDFRGRYDQITGDNGSGNAPYVARERFRYRARIGATANMTDDIEVGVRIGSGDTSSVIAGQGSAFSGNTTMDSDASRKPVFIDLAYAKYTPASWAELQVGKMMDQVWASPMIFSPDYNPEGAQERFSMPLGQNHSVNLTGGQWVVTENSAAVDTFAFVEQVDWTAKWHKKFSTRVGIGAYSFFDRGGVTATDESYVSAYQNGTPLNGTYANANGLVYGAQNINPIFVRAEATYSLDSFPFYKGEFPITISGEYVNNPGANGLMANGTHQPYDGTQNTAYNAGVTFGSSKQKGNWQIGYTYKNIETASLWRGFIDDNFGFNGKGGTDVRGHLISASYKVFAPLQLGVSYFKTEQINNIPTKLNEQDRLFVEMIFSF